MVFHSVVVVAVKNVSHDPLDQACIFSLSGHCLMRVPVEASTCDEPRLLLFELVQRIAQREAVLHVRESLARYSIGDAHHPPMVVGVTVIGETDGGCR